MNDFKIIVIDDDVAILKTLRRILKPKFGYITAVSSPAILPGLLHQGGVDVVLLDMNFSKAFQSGKEGLFWLAKILSFPHHPSVILMTAFSDIDLVITSFKNGAVDFIIKPWDNDRLIQAVEQAIARKEERKLKLLVEKTEEEASAVLALEEMEKQLIRHVLEKNERNIAICADILKVSRQTLYNKIKKYNL
ncbi:response regulator [Massilibacteroides sp.]|uniref:response regulator n=1 Tax=Massilibacteroides sp. TaxID=2034766 RepID=UPI002613E337|nr:response regulator [Massilibacteroides sp.]MDD4515163.1 response regulator [Massilibacteroides sp.]